MLVFRRPDRGGSPKWLAVTCLATFLVAVVLAVWILFSISEGRERSDQWSSILMFPLAVLTATVPVLVLAIRRARAANPTFDEAVVVKLRDAVREVWTAEVAARQALLPRPLTLTWAPTSVAGAQVEALVGRAGAAPWGALRREVDDYSPAVELAEMVNTTVARQVVLLGAPGAGKTTLAMLYVVAAARTAAADDPVPVPLAIAGWDPTAGIGIETWVSRGICRDYPDISPQEAAWLVRNSKVIPVLDGLDEVPEASRGNVLTHLEKMAARGMRMMMTSRSQEFADATAEVGALPQALVIDVKPVEVVDAVAYLTQREAVGNARWSPLTEALMTDPKGTLATALSTPLMLSLARQIYQKPATNPQELEGLTTRQEIEQRLLDRFLPSVYGSERAAAKSGQYLALLVGYLRAHRGDPDLAWWRLARAVPRPVIALLTLATVTSVGACGGLTAGLLGGGGSAKQYALDGATIFALIGLVVGLRTARSAHASDGPRRRADWLFGVGAGVADLYVAVAIFSAVATGIIVGAHLFSHPMGGEIGTKIADILRAMRSFEPSTFSSAVIVALVPLIMIIVVSGIGAGRRGMPRRATPRLRALPQNLVPGFAVGALTASPLVILQLLGIVHLSPVGERALAALLAATVGIPLALGRWLSSPVSHRREGSSPQAALRTDRNALVVTVAGVAIATGVVVAVLVTVVNRSMPDDLPLPVVGFSLSLAGVSAILILFGSDSVWVSFTIARLWLALRRRAPWRLMLFLRRAHEAQVLRQAGSVYQIRHEVVGTYLMQRWASNRRGKPETQSKNMRYFARRAVSARRTLIFLLSTTAVVSLPPVAFAFDNRPSPAIILERRSLDAQFSPDGRVLATLDEDGKVRLRDGATGRAFRVFGEKEGYLQFAPDGDRLFTVDDNGVMRLRDATTGRPIVTFGSVQVFPRFSPDGQIFATSGMDGTARLWDAVTGQAVAALTTDKGIATEEQLWVSAFSPDGRTAATVSEDGAVHLFDTHTARLTGTVTSSETGVENSAAGIDVQFSPDGSTFVTSGGDTARLWESATLQLVASFERGNTARYSPDGRVIVTFGADDGAAHLWNAVTGRLVARIDHPSHAVLFAPDGRSVATVGTDGLVCLWQPATGRLVATIEHPSGGALFSPDGRTVATVGADDEVVRLWNTAGKRLGTLYPVVSGGYSIENGAPSGVMFSPSGRILAMINKIDERIQLWDVPES